MSSVPIQVFLSCSFDKKDKKVVEFFSIICNGLDIKCVNVDKGSVLPPQEKARELIENSRALIAIATRRDELKSGGYSMPKSVDDEISIAFGCHRQILIFLEKDVEVTSGFTGKYSNYHRFDRASLYSPKILGKIIASIHNMKMSVISPHEIADAILGPKNVIAESARWLIELIDNSGSFTWRYTVTRKLKFLGRFTEPIKHGIWPNDNMPLRPTGITPNISTKYSIEPKSFTIKPTEYIRSSNGIDVSLEFDPIPCDKDEIEYSMIIESPYLNAVFHEDLETQRPQVTINGKKYLCRMGNTPNIYTQNLEIQCRFPANIGLTARDFEYFAGSYIHGVQYFDETETKRMVYKNKSFGGNIVIDIEVNNPLTYHYYGVAWNPQKRP